MSTIALLLDHAGRPHLSLVSDGVVVAEGRSHTHRPGKVGLRNEISEWITSGPWPTPMPAMCVTPAARKALGGRRVGALVRAGMLEG
jgi:hypothetical protein